MKAVCAIHAPLGTGISSGHEPWSGTPQHVFVVENWVYSIEFCLWIFSCILQQFLPAMILTFDVKGDELQEFVCRGCVVFYERIREQEVPVLASGSEDNNNIRAVAWNSKRITQSLVAVFRKG